MANNLVPVAMTPSEWRQRLEDANFVPGVEEWPKIKSLLLKHGRPYIGIDRPKGYRHQKKKKQCHRNAQITTIEGRGTYVEGLCMNGWLSFHHAWITLDSKHAIDQTLPYLGFQYFGIEFPIKFVADTILRHHPRPGFLLADPETAAFLAAQK